MFKKPQKRAFLIRRILLSVLATVSVLIIVTASILFMLGYRLDSGNGRLEQGALMQFDSQPGGANVWIDGGMLGGQTATKQTVVAGVHSVKMTKTGYEDWNRTLSIEAGTLTWLDYARLVPTNRSVQPVQSYTSLAALTYSPDRKWALALPNASLGTFQLIDLRSEAIKTADLVLPATLYSTEPDTASTFTLYRWNTGGRYIIVKHTYGDNKTEWLMVDTQEVAKSSNITRMLGVDLSDLQFTGSSGTSLYGLANDGVIRKIDLSAGTISRPLVSHVQSFSLLEDTSTLSYVGMDPADTTKKVAGIYKDGENGPTILRTAQDPSRSLHIDVGRYFSDTFVAIAEGQDVEILTGPLPSDGASENNLKPYGRMQLKAPVSALSFSPNADYVLAQSGADFKSYELEHKRTNSGAITPAEGQSATTLRWLDGAHVWNDDTSFLTMRDFDGANSFAIMPVARGFDASLSTNGRFMYSVGKTDTGYQLQRVRMILE